MPRKSKTRGRPELTAPRRLRPAPPCHAPPCLAAPRRAPPRPRFGFDKFGFGRLDYKFHFPDMHCKKRFLQGQKGDGPLVNSQERRALFVLLINRGSNSDPMRVQRGLCSSTGLHGISLVRAPEEMFRTGFFDALAGTGDGCPLGEPTCRRSVLPGPAPPRRPAVCRPVPTRRGMSGFWIRQVSLTRNPDMTWAVRLGGARRAGLGAGIRAG